MTEAEMNAKINRAYEGVIRVKAEFQEVERQLKETRARLIEVEDLNMTLREALVKEITKHI